MHVMTPSIPSTIPLNNTKTIQNPCLLVDSSLVSYVVLLILHGLKSCLSFTGWLFMKLVIFGFMLHMFESDLNIYGLDLNSIYPLDLHIHQFSPVAHHFPTLAPYPHGDTKPLVFVAPYDNIYDI